MSLDSKSLDRFSFLWSEVRLVVAAVALFLGGVPPLLKFGGLPAGTASTLLQAGWGISGLASVYLLYRWMQAKRVFGSSRMSDPWPFWVSVLSGINLGLVPVLHKNLGMSIWSGKLVFIVVGLVYLYCAYYLYNRWKGNGERVF